MPLYSNPLRTTGRPLQSYFPQPDDYGTDVNSVDVADIPQVPSLIAGGVGNTPMEQAQWKINANNLLNQAQGSQQAQQFMDQSPQFDPTTAEGQTGMQRLLTGLPYAASQPSVQNVIKESRQAHLLAGRNAPLTPQAAQFLTQLYGMDVTDPSAFKAVQANLAQHPEYLEDPRIGPQVQHVFRQQAAIANRPSKFDKFDPNNIDHQMAMAGIPPEEIDQMRDPQIGQVPTLNALYRISQSKSVPKEGHAIPAKHLEELVGLNRSILSPSDDDKRDAFQQQYPGTPWDPSNQQHWGAGFQLAQRQAAAKRAQLLAALQGSGIRLPSSLLAAPGSPASGPVQVNSPEEFAALPRGTRFIDSQGQRGTKP